MCGGPATIGTELRPTLWTLAGGNGAGKSTFHRLYLEPRGVAFVNADVIAREIDPSNPAAASYEAARMTMRRFADFVGTGVPFAYESVFSHPSKVDMLASARAAGYRVVLVYVHLDRPELHPRVRHFVPQLVDSAMSKAGNCHYSAVSARSA